MNDSRRALVLDATCPVFESLGIEGASIGEIAMQAGHTPGAIYSCFDNNEAIYEALLAESLARLNAEDALRGNTSLFAHGVGLLLRHTGRIRIFGHDARMLFDAYLIRLAERLQRDATPG